MWTAHKMHNFVVLLVSALVAGGYIHLMQTAADHIAMCSLYQGLARIGFSREKWEEEESL